MEGILNDEPLQHHRRSYFKITRYFRVLRCVIICSLLPPNSEFGKTIGQGLLVRRRNSQVSVFFSQQTLKNELHRPTKYESHCFLKTCMYGTLYLEHYCWRVIIAKKRKLFDDDFSTKQADNDKDNDTGLFCRAATIISRILANSF